MKPLGSKENPYENFNYVSMLSYGMWEGGWVRLNDMSVVYKTATGKTEQDMGDYELGDEENPFSRVAFCELLEHGCWEGGWVREGDGSGVHYYRTDGERENCGCDDTNGCGCGCGCGEGCGCGGDSVIWAGGLIAGSETIRPSGMPANKELTITWESGTFSAFGNPSLSASYTNASAGETASVGALWESPYRVIINATIRVLINNEYQLNAYTVYYDIPGNYRC